MDYFDYNLIPKNCIKALDRYSEKHIRPGDFLKSVLENNLFLSVSLADDYNITILPVYVNYMYNELPMLCWGNKEKVEKWLQKQHESISLYRCKVILKEPHGYNISREYPDVLGTGMKNDINIECKVSRQDFLKDGKKQHKHPFGNFKFYACPEGLILPDEIPEEFGLIYIGKESCRMIKKPLYVKECENTAPMLADLFLNRNNKVWDGKAVIL